MFLDRADKAGAFENCLSLVLGCDGDVQGGRVEFEEADQEAEDVVVAMQ